MGNAVFERPSILHFYIELAFFFFFFPQSNIFSLARPELAIITTLCSPLIVMLQHEHEIYLQTFISFVEKQFENGRWIF